MVDGLISIRRREDDAKEEKPRRKKVSYRYAGENLHSTNIDTFVHEVTKEVMGKHDVCLRKFQYTKALDSVMMNYVVNKTPHVTVALFQELVRRQGLIQALAGRDGKSLVNVIKFLIKYIGNIRYGRVLLHVANVLMGKQPSNGLFKFVNFIYYSLDGVFKYLNDLNYLRDRTSEFWQSGFYSISLDVYEDNLEELAAEAQTLFGLLARKLDEEKELTISLSELQGTLQMILSGAETTPASLPAIKDSQGLEPSSAAQKSLILSIT